MFIRLVIYDYVCKDHKALHTMVHCKFHAHMKYKQLHCVYIFCFLFPAPKRASRISWHQQLEDLSLDHHSPRHTPTKPKSALRHRPIDFMFPYVEDKPSPIVITRLRRSKSLSRSREWPWWFDIHHTYLSLMKLWIILVPMNGRGFHLHSSHTQELLNCSKKWPCQTLRNVNIYRLLTVAENNLVT